MSEFPSDCAQKFAPQRPLARGGFGAVWLATQLKLKRDVAVKVLHADLLASPGDVDRFMAEARITAQMSHPSVVVVIDHGAEHGVPWIAFEYLPGRTLAQMLKEGPLPWASALAIAAQIAGALEEAHGRGVLHRDIKPSNVIEVSPGRVKVADFGIAKWADREGVRTETGVIVGTPLYLAPEIADGQPASPATDLYALGVVLFQMLTGRLPFEHASVTALLDLHRGEPPPPPSSLRPDLPAGLDALALKLLAKSPLARPLTAREAREALESFRPAPGSGGRRVPRAISRGLATDVVPAAPSLPPSPPFRMPSPAQAIAAAAASAAVLGLLIGLAVRGTRSPPPPAPSPTPPSSTSLAPSDRLSIEAGFAELARHVAADPTFRSVRATLSSTTPDVAAAARVAKAADAGEAANLRQVTELAELVERAVPEPAGAAFEDARLALRARAYRFVFWRRRHYCRRHAEVYGWAVASGNDTVMSLVTINMMIAKPADNADGLALFLQYLDAARPVLQALPEELARGAAGFEEICDDFRTVAREAGWVRWSDGSRRQLDARVEAFKRALTADDRPVAYSIARLASSLWELGCGPTPVRRQALSQVVVEDLRLVQRQVPSTRDGAQRLIDVIEAEARR